MNNLIDVAITELSSRKNVMGAIARRVQQQPAKDPLNRIAQTYIALQKDRQLAKVSKSSVEAKPESLFNFIQNVSNAACWAARRVQRAQALHNAEEQAAGIDFSADIAAEAGLECVSVDHIASEMDSVFLGLLNVHSWLGVQMNYLSEIADLYMFADLRPPVADTEVGSGNWELRHSAMDWDGVMSVLDVLVDEMNEERETVVATEAATLKFAA